MISLIFILMIGIALFIGTMAVIMSFVATGFILLFGATGYLLSSYSIYKLAKKHNTSYPILSFIPVLQVIMLDRITGGLKYKGREIKNTSYLVVIFAIIASLLFKLDMYYLSNICKVLVYVALNITMLKVWYMLMNNSDHYFFALLSIIFPFLLPVLLFIVRNNEIYRREILSNTN